MLETIAIILIILWALGIASSFTIGGFNILLITALVVIVIRLIQLIQGRRIL